MKQRHQLLILLMILLFNACATKNYYIEIPPNQDAIQFQESISVANPDHPNFNILKTSAIYRIEANSPNQLILQDDIHYGNGWQSTVDNIFKEIAGVGLFINIKSKDACYFRYKIITPSGEKSYRHYLNIYTISSIWQWFMKPFTQSKEELKIEALKHTKREEE